jgi:nitrite reductase/ring-hydroxylating ferredoxin subunit/uncharacterized membrane protein
MTARLNGILDGLVARIEAADVLDKPAALATGTLRLPLKSRRIRSALSGTPIGHPAHPMVVVVPMGTWVAATCLDIAGTSPAAAQTLVGTGVLAALPAVFTGASDLYYTDGSERRVGLVHAAGNWVAIGLYASSWLARKRGAQHTGIALAASGGLVLSAAGWLGGHLAYARGVGVDTTAFQPGAPDWVDVIADAELVADQPTPVHVGAEPVLLIRRGDSVFALADRCTHRGAPLHEGKIHSGTAAGDCVVCPWHDSEFRLADGQVTVGPATRPQPTFEVRTRYGQIQVRNPATTTALRAAVAT